MARTTINSLGVPAGTIVAADLSYPLTTFSSTGIDDNADAIAITIDSSENVGIGTTSPEAKLHLNAADGGTLRLSDVSASSDGDQIGGIQAAAGSGTFYSGINFFRHDSNDGEIRFRTKVNNSNTDVMTIVDGNVGVITTNPAASLHISETSSGLTARFSNESNQTLDIGTVAGSGSSGSAYFDNPNSGNIQFRTGGTERMRIDSNGYVTKPQTPIFSYGQYSTYTLSATGTQVVSTSTAWNNSSYVHINVNNGSHFNASNGRFTAPVAGIYRFDYKCAVSNHGSGYFWWYIYKNGSSAIAYWQSTQGMTSGSDDYALAYMQVYIDLAVNDYVDVRWANNYSASQRIHYPHFSGALVG